MQHRTLEQEIMDFLNEHVFGPVICSPKASERLKKGCRLAQMRIGQRNSGGMVHYFWSAIVGTNRSTSFAELMRKEGFTRFEDVIPEFRRRFQKPKVIFPAR